MNKREIGTKKEQETVQYLIDKGYQILECNFRCRFGEIDIIASYNHVIIFVEVKYRQGKQYGSAIEAVSPKKQQTIRKVAMYYLVTKLHTDHVPCRFDVVGIDGDEFTHMIDAF